MHKDIPANTLCRSSNNQGEVRSLKYDRSHLTMDYTGAEPVNDPKTNMPWSLLINLARSEKEL